MPILSYLQITAGGGKFTTPPAAIGLICNIGGQVTEIIRNMHFSSNYLVLGYHQGQKRAKNVAEVGGWAKTQKTSLIRKIMLLKCPNFLNI